MSHTAPESGSAKVSQPAMISPLPNSPVAGPPVTPIISEPSLSTESAAPPVPVYVPTSLRLTAAWSWRFIVTGAALFALAWLVRPISTVLVSLLVAMILAVLMDPLSSLLRRRLRFPRFLASLTAIVVVFAAVLAALVLAGREIFSQFPMLRDQALAGWNQLTLMLEDTPFALTAEQLQQWTDQVINVVNQNRDNLLSGALSVGSTIADIGLGVVVVVFSLLFFLKDGRRIWQWFVRLLPAQSREAANEAGIRAWVTLGDYARTQIVVALIDAIFIALGAWVLGVPFVVPIGVLVFLASFIPVVGAVLSGAVAVLVALVTQGAVDSLIMLGIVLAVQQLESNVVSPLLMSGAVSLHPLVIFIAVIIASTLFGIAGALFAVPFCAMVNTVVLYLSGHDKMPELNTRWQRPGGPPGVLLPSIRESYRRPTKEHPNLTDEQLDALVMERAGGPDSVPVPTPADAHVEAHRRETVDKDPHEGPRTADDVERGETQEIADSVHQEATALEADIDGDPASR